MVFIFNYLADHYRLLPPFLFWLLPLESDNHKYDFQNLSRTYAQQKFLYTQLPFPGFILIVISSKSTCLIAHSLFISGVSKATLSFRFLKTKIKILKTFNIPYSRIKNGNQNKLNNFLSRLDQNSFV